MELFPTRPRPRLSWSQLAVTCCILFAANLALAIWTANRGRGAVDQSFAASPAIHSYRTPVLRADQRPAPYRANGPSPAAEQARTIAIILVANAAILSGLAYAVLARYLEALRRYNMGIPSGFPETRLRHGWPPPSSRFSFDDRFAHGLSDPDGPSPSRFDWPN